MGWYLLKLFLILPLLAGLIWASLKLTRRMQERIAGGDGRPRRAQVLETSFLAPGIRIAVIEFHGKEILVSASRNGLTRLAEADPAERLP